MRASRLALAEKLGATHARRAHLDLAAEISKRTNGELIHYWIDASGAGPVFDLAPLMMRHQATFLFYGSGHTGQGCWMSGSVSVYGDQYRHQLRRFRRI